MQLPFLVVQEKERTSPEMDAEKGTLFLPSFANLDQLQAFEFAKNRFGVSFDALYKKAKEDGSYDLGVWENARFFVSFSGRDPPMVLTAATQRESKQATPPRRKPKNSSQDIPRITVSVLLSSCLRIKAVLPKF
jgi:hypothetical protein